MALVNGQWVRMKIAPDTRIGTIEGSEVQRGRTMYIFRQDPRLKEAVPSGPTVEIFLGEDEVEPCPRPTDAYWKTVNDRIERGS
jgi:hypothetical protein